MSRCVNVVMFYVIISLDRKDDSHGVIFFDLYFVFMDSLYFSCATYFLLVTIFHLFGGINHFVFSSLTV